MGICLSTESSAHNGPKTTDALAMRGPVTHDMAVGDADPKPMVFALMRNGHEVIRGAMRDLDRLLFDKECDYATATHEWCLLSRWQELHAAMEEGSGEPGESPLGFFNVLDKYCDNVATENGLFDGHDELHKYEHALDEAFKSRDMNDIRKAYKAYMEANEAHLKHEESIMMPQVQKLFKNGHPMKKYMKEEMIANVRHDMEFFIKYAVGTLQHHSQTMPRMRVVGHALWAIADDDEEWKVWNGWIQEAVTPINYAALEAVLP